MDKLKFDSIFPIIISHLTDKIAKETNLTEDAAIAELYRSGLYAALEKEETKMSKTLEFKIFCLESYKTAHNMNGVSVLDVFNKYSVFDYIEAFYDVLHSTGQQYIVEDIDLFMKARQPAES